MPEAHRQAAGLFLSLSHLHQCLAAADPAADRQHLHPGSSPRAAAVPADGLHAPMTGRNGLLNCPDHGFEWARSLGVCAPRWQGRCMIPRQGTDLRGVALGVALTFLFTAANIYLGLKVGLTFATSIPAAVISMAFLGLFSGSNIRENNIVQTVCSSAGALASVIFVLPGLVIIGWWTGFPFWTSFLRLRCRAACWACCSPFRCAAPWSPNPTCPIRKALRPPKCCKVGADMRAENPEAREGLLAVVYGSLASAGLAIAVAMRLATDDVARLLPARRPARPATHSLFRWRWWAPAIWWGFRSASPCSRASPIAWAGAVPILTAMTPMHGDLASFVTGIWRNDVRFIGAGAMAVAAVWSLLRTDGPDRRRPQGHDARARRRGQPARPDRPRHVFPRHPGDWCGVDGGQHLAGVALLQRGGLGRRGALDRTAFDPHGAGWRLLRRPPSAVIWRA